MNYILYPFRRLAMWLVCSSPIPFGNIAPHLFNFAIGQRGQEK